MKYWALIFPPSIGDAICASASMMRIVISKPEIKICTVTSTALKSIFQNQECVYDSFSFDEVKNGCCAIEFEWLIDLASDDISSNLYSYISYLNIIARHSTIFDAYIVNDSTHSLGVFTKGAMGREGNPNEPAWFLEAPLVAHALNENFWNWEKEGFEPELTFKSSSVEDAILGYDIILAPCGSFELKKWPEENWVCFSNWLVKAGYKVAVVLGPHESDGYKNLTNCQGIDIYSNYDLLFIAKLMRKVKVVVANDCGPMHLAAASGVPVIAIFGPTNPKIWFRYSKIRSAYLQIGAPENEWGELHHLKDRAWDFWPTCDNLIATFKNFIEIPI